ncbi:MAG: PaaI family thioesterase [Gaiellaceae bacterium]
MSRIPPHHDPACWGCGDNPNGIRLSLPEHEGIDEYEGYFHFDERHQGGPGIAHGGLVSAALDEACGLLASWYRFPAVTARMFVRYRRPVPIHTELRIRAELESSHGRRVRVSAAITDGAETLAEARGAFLHVPLEHFLATPEGRASAQAWRARLTDT